VLVDACMPATAIPSDTCDPLPDGAANALGADAFVVADAVAGSTPLGLLRTDVTNVHTRIVLMTRRYDMSMIFRRTSCKGARRTIRATIPMFMGTAVFSALIIVLVNLIIDISYGFLDPRMHEQ
jgi:hypothetical protein